jgi:mannose-6-phosphate isomerase-like protein (cupin superfamily)
MDRIEKPWGHEVLWARTDAYAGKILVIHAGHRLSLQHHRVKDEAILVLEGKLLLELEGDDGVLASVELPPGESRRIRAGRRHRFTAVTDVRLIEVSTPELDDVVRHQDDYGRSGRSDG